MSTKKVETSPELKEKYNAILKSVISKEPVEFKKVFEDVMRLKATSYISLVKEEMSKSVFNASEVENERLDEDYDPDIEFHVADKTSGSVKGKYANIKRARNSLDKHDNKHGSYQHTIKYYHKGKKEYVPMSQTAKKTEE